MTTDRRVLAGALGLALLVAACGGSASATPTPAASTAGQAPGDSAVPSTPAINLPAGNAGDLEALIPTTVGTMTLQKTSFDLSTIPLAGMPFDNSKLSPLLAKYGKTAADVRMAMGIAASATGATEVIAIQLKGVPATEFMTQLGSTTAADQISLGGKTVYGSSGAGMSSIVYPHDDILFLVIAADADAATIVAALP